MKPRTERIEYLRKAHKAINDDQTVHYSYSIKNWRGYGADKTLHRKILAVDVDYLMFRVENSRTEIQQLKYIREHSLGIDFFSDPESVLAQEAQEGILFKMIREKGKEFLDDLDQRGQEDPCIITYDGYIVNGNRRTAALKHLEQRYVNCVILPDDTTPKDIYILEQQLQISKHFREEYHWINELRNIRRGKHDKSLNLSETEIAKNLRLESKDLKLKLLMIDLIDSFLNWKHLPGQFDYSKLDDTEEVFGQLAKGIKKYRDTIKQEALKNAVFNLIEVRPETGRLYNYVMALIKDFDAIYSKLKEVSTPEIDPVNSQDKEQVYENDLLDQMISEIDEKNDPIFSDSNNANEISSKLIEAISDIKALNRERRDTEAAYQAVSTALRELQGIIIETDTAKKSSIENKLRQIIDTSNRILSELKYDDNQ